MIAKPMLAGKVEDINALQYPLIATPKLDGIRCLVRRGMALTRKFLPVPNEHVRRAVEQGLRERLGNDLDELVLDGELMLRDRWATFQEVTSAIMKRTGEPPFVYHVFDVVGPTLLTDTYVNRIDALERLVKKVKLPWLRYVEHQIVRTQAQLERYETTIVSLGYEGVMLRDQYGPYKQGRSTFKEGWLLKLKRFEDAEAAIIGFEEAYENTNQATLDFTGHRKRSHAKSGMVPKGTLGAFVVKQVDEDNGQEVEFRIGTGKGLTAELRQYIWDRQDEFLGKVVKFRYQLAGSKDAPRIPSFQGFRDERDM